MGKVIPWELCKKLKFDQTNKWYMYNPESVMKNKMPKLLWYLVIKTGQLISARRQDLIIINKIERTYRIVDFAVSMDHRVRLKVSEKGAKVLDLARELKKTVEHESDDYTDCNGFSCYRH